MRSLLIIFYRNPELSKVKTRLAASVGDEYALAIYFKLVSHTRSIVTSLPMDKVLYYSDFVDHEDYWEDKYFDKMLQTGADLGERMMNAFSKGFQAGYEKICIIGTDCFELATNHIEGAYHELKKNDVVIGPTLDGGYYLLGMKKFYPALFQKKNWSTGTVRLETLQDCKALSLKVSQLVLLRDVDTVDDLPSEMLPKKSL